MRATGWSCDGTTDDTSVLQHDGRQRWRQPARWQRSSANARRKGSQRFRAHPSARTTCREDTICRGREGVVAYSLYRLGSAVGKQHRIVEETLRMVCPQLGIEIEHVAVARVH